MQHPGRPEPRRNKRLAALLATATIVVVAAVWLRREPSPAKPPTASDAATAETPPPVDSGKKPEVVGSPASQQAPAGADRRSLEEIIAADDVCAFIRRLEEQKRLARELENQGTGGAVKSMSETEDAARLFAASGPLLPLFQDYLGGIKAAYQPKSIGAQVLRSLAHAGLVVGESVTVKSDLNIALAGIRVLLIDDPKNAALMIFEFAILADPSTAASTAAEREQLIEELETASTFSTHQLELSRSFAEADDPRAIAQYMKGEFLKTVAAPNWPEIISRVRSGLRDNSGLSRKLAELMAAEAKAARQPSYSFGYSALELKAARMLAGPQSGLPSGDEIDRSLASPGIGPLGAISAAEMSMKTCGAIK